ncbi:suppressor of los1-1, partial [Elasticomyces elasticus]
LLKNDLLDKIPSEMGTPKIHTIDERFTDEESGQKVAELYQERIRRTFGDQSITDVPIFDLILLGCGPDGNICSLFPGHDLLREEKAWVAPETDSPKPPSRRISLTLPVVTAVSAICFIVPGEGSDGALKHVFTAQGDKSLPAGVVNQLGQEKVRWFTDSAAMDGVNIQ